MNNKTEKKIKASSGLFLIVKPQREDDSTHVELCERQIFTAKNILNFIRTASSSDFQPSQLI